MPAPNPENIFQKEAESTHPVVPFLVRTEIFLKRDILQERISMCRALLVIGFFILVVGFILVPEEPIASVTGAVWCFVCFTIGLILTTVNLALLKTYANIERKWGKR